MDKQYARGKKVRDALRRQGADYFIMQLPVSASKAASLDRHPLRRCLRLAQREDTTIDGENMCAAMWQLMARR